MPDRDPQVTCSVSPCLNPPVVWLRFLPRGLVWYGYCRWHGYRGATVRWSAWLIAEVSTVHPKGD